LPVAAKDSRTIATLALGSSWSRESAAGPVRDECARHDSNDEAVLAEVDQLIDEGIIEPPPTCQTCGKRVWRPPMSARQGGDFCSAGCW